MIIRLQDISKRYTNHWIIRNLNYVFDEKKPYALLGSNGSGKSTLLKMISGYLSPSKGSIAYMNGDKELDLNNIYKEVAYAAPYVSPLKGLTIHQMLKFYGEFKKMRNNFGVEDAFEIMDLPVSMDTLISELSSGQEQRVRLSLAILADTSILLLDEPGSYLDENSKIWFQNLLQNNLANRITIIASNDKSDLIHTSIQLNIEDFK
jgi:ABC-type multidrug transport system ATPase subunit